MSTLQKGGIFAILLVAIAAPAMAQDPTVNDSDMDTGVDEADESYLNDTSENETAATPADPTMNESDFDTSAPPADESYLGEEESTAAPSDAADPTMTESDFDTSVPPADESYLADGAADASGDGAGRGTPGAGLVAVLGVLAVAALVARRE